MTENNTKQPDTEQEAFTKATYDYPDDKTDQRRLRRARRSVNEAVSENQWLLPVAGSVRGVLLAYLLGRTGGNPDPDFWSVTVDKARSSVLGALSILFAGLSIVLALGSVTIQNVVGRFSLRLLRIYLRNPWDKAVIAVFALAATFILTEWFLLSAQPTDTLAPVGGVITGLLLLFLSGAMIIWYISALTSWFRVDRTVRRIGKLTLRAARSVERQYREEFPVAESFFKRPAEAIDVPAMVLYVVNAAKNGAGISVAGDLSSIEDGLMDSFILNMDDLKTISGSFDRMLNLDTSNAKEYMRQGKEMTIETDPDQPVWTDGEYTGRTPINLKVVPAALPIVVP